MKYLLRNHVFVIGPHFYFEKLTTSRVRAIKSNLYQYWLIIAKLAYTELKKPSHTDLIEIGLNRSNVFCSLKLKDIVLNYLAVSVSQLVRAFVSHAEGCAFESLRRQTLVV